MLALVPDLGDPTSYLELEAGTRVYGSDGGEIGAVEHVLADADADIFDGLVIDTRVGPAASASPTRRRSTGSTRAAWC